MSFVRPDWPIGYTPSAEEWDALFTGIETGINVALQRRGAYAPATPYDENDVVFYASAFHVAIRASTGVTPGTSALDWVVLDGGGAAVADGSVTNAKIAAGVDAVKIGAGTVSNAEFGALDGVTGPLQNQIDAKVTGAQAATIAAAAATTAAQNTFEAGANVSIATNPGNGKQTISATGDLAATLSRQVTTATTANLANNATDAAQSVSLGRSAWVLRCATSAPAWVRIYASAAAQTADAARLLTEFPTAGSGVLLDVVTTPANLSLNLSPLAQIANMELAPVSTYHATIRNLSGGAAAITVTLLSLKIEL